MTKATKTRLKIQALRTKTKENSSLKFRAKNRKKFKKKLLKEKLRKTERKKWASKKNTDHLRIERRLKKGFLKVILMILHMRRSYRRN